MINVKKYHSELTEIFYQLITSNKKQSDIIKAIIPGERRADVLAGMKYCFDRSFLKGIPKN